MVEDTDSKRDEFDKIIEQYGKRIYQYCLGMLRSQFDAQDATQDIFMKAYEYFQELKHPQAIQSWLYRIAANHCINLLRRKKLFRFIALNDDIPNTEEELDNLTKDEYSQELANILNKLTAYERSVLTLRVVNDMEYSEISIILNKKPAAVRKQFERVKKKVEKNILSGIGGDAHERVISV